MIFVGVDVQTARGVTWAALNEAYESRGGGMLPVDGDYDAVGTSLLGVLAGLGAVNEVVVGIDAPRMPLTELRQWKWSAAGDVWTPCNGARGRHCEVVIRSLGLANPQWTPLEEEAKDWMRLGFRLFKAVELAGYIAYEVFPSASYGMLSEDVSGAVIKVDLVVFRPGPRDILDAYVAAYTVGEYVSRRGSDVGDGDNLGKIILPRKLPADAPAFLLSGPV
jgi:predicted nuclease with RNAse H fold